MPDEPDHRWMTYREIAQALGVTLRAAEARARRGRWRRQQGNNGVARVEVPVGALDPATRPPRRRAEGEHEYATKPPTVGAVLEELRAAHGRLVEELKQRVEAAEARASAANRRAEVAEVGAQQAAKAATEAEHQGRAVAGLRQELETSRKETVEARERAARAEGEIAGLRARSWLARFLGRP